MIKFFRGIRQNYLSEGKTGQYLKYAIGEILLVMIGILLALQVNTWNEKRKADQLQFEILQELRQSLESDLDDVERKIRMQGRIMQNQTIFIEWVESNENFSDTLSRTIFNTYNWTNFDAYDGPFETLKQLGMRNIRNDSLRNQISKLYDIVYTDYYLISERYERMLSELFKLSGGHFSELFSQSTKINDIEQLRSDMAYKSKLKTLKNLGSFLINGRMYPTKSEIEKTLKMLDQELDKT